MKLKETVGYNFLAYNKYGQLLHFRLVQIHVAGDGRKWYYLTRVDLGHGDKQAQCYSEGDMAEYRPFEK